MFLRSHRPRRRGTALVEAAIVYPVVMLLTIGLCVVGLGVFRYQQVAVVAREGARWASVHGGQWATDLNSGTLTTSDDIRTNAVVPHAAGLDTSPSKLICTVTYLDSGQMPMYRDGSGNLQTNIVTVTVTYTWVPELYLGTVTLSSTSKMPISY